MITITVPTGDLCVAESYPLSADCPGAVKVEWMVIEDTLPFGVSVDDIVYSNQYALDTDVTLPVAGTYGFVAKCWTPA